MQTPAQQEVAKRIETLLAVVGGYVDHVLDTVGQRPHRLLRPHRRGPAPAAGRGLRRRPLRRPPPRPRAGRAQYEKGHAFVRGVVERAGDDGLARLWHSERELPTPAELDAPGLWLARIDLPGLAARPGARRRQLARDRDRRGGW